MRYILSSSSTRNALEFTQGNHFAHGPLCKEHVTIHSITYSRNATYDLIHMKHCSSCWGSSKETTQTKIHHSLNGAASSVGERDKINKVNKQIHER